MKIKYCIVLYCIVLYCIVLYKKYKKKLYFRERHLEGLPCEKGAGMLASLEGVKSHGCWSHFGRNANIFSCRSKCHLGLHVRNIQPKLKRHESIRINKARATPRLVSFNLPSEHLRFFHTGVHRDGALESISFFFFVFL